MPGTARASPWPRTSRSTPARRIGNIITPDAASSRPRSPSGSASAWRRITLLEAHTHAEAKRARAQPADRARRELEHPHALVVDAQLRVDGALAQPERAAGIRGHAGHGRDDLAREPRRRGKDRLLKIGRLERVGRIEDRE